MGNFKINLTATYRKELNVRAETCDDAYQLARLLCLSTDAISFEERDLVSFAAMHPHEKSVTDFDKRFDDCDHLCPDCGACCLPNDEDEGDLFDLDDEQSCPVCGTCF